MSFSQIFLDKQSDRYESFSKNEKLPLFLIKLFIENPKLEIHYWQQLVAALTENQAIIENLISPIATILPDFGIQTDNYMKWTKQVLSTLKGMNLAAGFYGILPSRTGYLGNKSPFYFGRFLQSPVPLLENLLSLKRGEWLNFQEQEI